MRLGSKFELGEMNGLLLVVSVNGGGWDWVMGDVVVVFVCLVVDGIVGRGSLFKGVDLVEIVCLLMGGVEEGRDRLVGIVILVFVFKMLFLMFVSCLWLSCEVGNDVGEFDCGCNVFCSCFGLFEWFWVDLLDDCGEFVCEDWCCGLWN